MIPGNETSPLTANLPVTLPGAETLDVPAFEQMLSLKSLTNSYKLYWFAVIFDEIRNNRTELSFKEIVLKMITKCWYSVTAYKLTLGFTDNLGQLVSYIYQRYQPKNDISPQKLYALLENLRDPELDSRAAHFYRYVPYRLISPFFQQIKGIKDHRKNSEIEKLSQTPDAALYRIYGKEQRIVVNKNWFGYIYRNQVIISGWYYYKLIHFLQKRNPSIPAIPFKLEAPRKRELKPARTFWENIIKVRPVLDIYTGRPLSPDDFSIDHFIPWSFVLHDQLWNLAPTSRMVNSSKNDRLPDLERYLDKFCGLHFSAYKTALEHQFPPRMLEDYFEVNRGITYTREMKPEVFERNLKEHLLPLHQLARNQGFTMWEEGGKGGR